MPGTDAIRVACCDDSLAMRRLLHVYIDECDDLVHVGEAANGLQAVDLVRTCTPDVLVLDLDMPPYSGVYALERIRGRGDDLPVVIHSGSAGARMRAQAEAAGATSFVPKDGDPADLIAEIRRVARPQRRAA